MSYRDREHESEDSYLSSYPKASVGSALFPSTDHIPVGAVAPMLGVMNPKVDYLDYDPKGRHVGERLSYNTGTTYLGGIVLGGAVGVIEGLRKSPSNKFKIRLNSVLNNCSRRGSKVGNAFGVLSLLYTGFEQLADTIELDKYVSGDGIGVAAAGATGLVYRSTAGARTCILAGLSGVVLMGTYTIGERFFGQSSGSRSKAGLFL